MSLQRELRLTVIHILTFQDNCQTLFLGTSPQPSHILPLVQLSTEIYP